jgi:squalene-hopene/tetraprenyl-beta-curcumene cyclase
MMNPKRVVLVAGLAVAIAVAIGTRPAATQSNQVRWDAASAARYLDARMDTWWRNAKVLKTGTADERCLSCHTAVPYVMARPRLRRLLGDHTLTAHESRIVNTVTARVASMGNQQPYYDHTEDKKVESRGVEAVLNAFVLAMHDADRKADRPSEPTRAAIARLWEVQRPDGAFDWLNFGLEPYEAPDAVFYGAVLAAMAANSAPASAASANGAGKMGLERLSRYIRSNVETQRLFNRAWALLATSHYDALSQPQRAAIVRDLEAAQRDDGGWSMNDLGAWRWDKTEAPFAGPGKTEGALLSAADGYATGLVVYALKQSRSRSPAVSKGQEWLRSRQVAETAGDTAWAPWRAHSLNFDREHGGPKGEPWRRMFMSDLATAFAVLALAE